MKGNGTPYFREIQVGDFILFWPEWKALHIISYFGWLFEMIAFQYLTAFEKLLHGNEPMFFLISDAGNQSIRGIEVECIQLLGCASSCSKIVVVFLIAPEN